MGIILAYRIFRTFRSGFFPCLLTAPMYVSWKILIIHHNFRRKSPHWTWQIYQHQRQKSSLIIASYQYDAIGQNSSTTRCLDIWSHQCLRRLWYLVNKRLHHSKTFCWTHLHCTHHHLILPWNNTVAACNGVFEPLAPLWVFRQRSK